MLEMLAEANWERPIYMAVSVGTENHLGMGNHFIQEGLTYRSAIPSIPTRQASNWIAKMYEDRLEVQVAKPIGKVLIHVKRHAYVLFSPTYLLTTRRSVDT